MTNSHPSAVVLGAALLAASQLVTATAFAADRSPSARVPFRAGVERKETELLIDRYQKPLVVERVKTGLRRFAVFHAEPQTIEADAVIVFEIQSVSAEGSVPRWRCVAVDDVAECLGQPVKIRYLPDDEKVVLRAVAKPRNTEEGRALAAASHAHRAESATARR